MSDLFSPDTELEQARTLISEALILASRQGATAEAAISSGTGFTVNVRLGEVETIEHHRDKELGITVFLGQRKGNASTADFRAEAIRSTVQAACDIARYGGEDPYAGLVEPAYLARSIPELDLYHPWDLEPEAAILLAQECESAARSQDPRISNSDGASVTTHTSIHAYGNSHGFLGGWAKTSGSIACAVVARDETSGMQRDSWSTAARRAALLESPVAVGEKAAARTLRRLNARHLSSRKTPVVFEAPVARDLFSRFIAAISGGNLYRHTSFLVDHLGKPVLSPVINIAEQPHLPQALGSAPFDHDGVATQERQLVAEGVLQGYVLSAYSARRLGMMPTGNAGGVHNLNVQPGVYDLQDLLRQMDTGFLVTELMGFGVNLVTGDYSRGAAGFWVEGGEIQFPVEEVTLAGNLRDMFQNIVAVGNDVDRRGNLRTGSVLIEAMTIAGK